MERLNLPQENSEANKSGFEALTELKMEPQQEAPKSRIDLTKPSIVLSDGTIGTLERTKTHYSKFERYETQMSEIEQKMREAYESGKPLQVLNIGVAEGQEALGYIQMASNLAGEDKISDALDLELVEYAREIPVTNGKMPEGYKESSREYLKKLYNSEKAHFGTPFQGFVKEMREKGEKRDVVLFNNVIQHLDYKTPTKAEMLSDMENLAAVVADNGILCMTCEGFVIEGHPEVRELIEATRQMLVLHGFTEEEQGIFRKTGIKK